MQISDQLIHDEANSGAEVLKDPSVDRQLEVTSNEFDRKWKILEKALANGKLGKFTSVIRNSSVKANSKFEVVLFTEEGAGLTVNLRAYGNGGGRTCFFSTRGSPTKLLSGQNLVELREHETITKIQDSLGCSAFEARSLCGFWLMQKAVQDEFKVPFFSKEERSKLRSRDVSIYSIGYASYESLGFNRDKVFDLLITLCGAKFPCSGVLMSLPKFLKIEAETHGPESKKGEGWYGRDTTLRLRKTVEGGRASFSQTFYLKEQEVAAKKFTRSGELNHREMSNLSKRNLSAVHTELVRVDNVFYGDYLAQWLNAAYGMKVNHNKVMLKDIAPLFDHEDNIRIMVGDMANEIGLRTLLLAPTVEFIESLAFRTDGRVDEKTKEIIKNWMRVSPTLTVNESTKEHRLQWTSVSTGASDSVRKRLNHLKEVEHLDLSLPFVFYSMLDELRMGHVSSLDDREALSHQFIGYSGFASKASMATAVQVKIKSSIRKDLLLLRTSFKLPPPVLKEVLAKSLILD